ncbi:MAG: recombinase family protein, partial [bacterium]
MNVAALYLRYSSDDKDTNSIINQEINLVKYCNDNNITIFNIYKDIAKTGTNLDRPGFQDMLSDLNKKLFNIVIVKDLSRLSR